MPDTNTLGSSLRLLTSITESTYPESIKAIALANWMKHLDPANPQWKHITIKAFNEVGDSSAHVLAMIDERLPGIGIVGYFGCTDTESGARVLKNASAWLNDSYGVNVVYGPINGTLPSDYRLNLKDDIAFPGEPVNPGWFIEAFKKAGFEVYNRYESGRSKLYILKLKTMMSKPRMRDDSIRVRRFDTDRYDTDFATYHDLRNRIFPFQSVYCPAISLEERYYISSGKFDADLTYFLTDKDTPVGFIMGYIYQNRLVIKTIGLLPEYRGKRLSGLLLKPIYEEARKRAVREVVFGLVRVGNTVHRSRGPWVKVFRNYVTMSKKFT